MQIFEEIDWKYSCLCGLIVPLLRKKGKLLITIVKVEFIKGYQK